MIQLNTGKLNKYLTVKSVVVLCVYRLFEATICFFMIDFPRHFHDYRPRGTGHRISEKSPKLKKVDAQLYMEIDRKLTFVIKICVLKLYLFQSPSYPLNQLSFPSNII